VPSTPYDTPSQSRIAALEAALRDRLSIEFFHNLIKRIKV
jgi:hypothetical protein